MLLLSMSVEMICEKSNVCMQMEFFFCNSALAWPQLELMFEKLRVQNV